MTNAEISAAHGNAKLAPNSTLAAWLILTTGNSEAAKLKALDPQLLAALKMSKEDATRMVQRFNQGHGDSAALAWRVFSADTSYTGPDCPMPEQIQNIANLP